MMSWQDDAGIVRKSRFKKDFRKLLSSGKDLGRLAEVVRLKLCVPDKAFTSIIRLWRGAGA